MEQMAAVVRGEDSDHLRCCALLLAVALAQHGAERLSASGLLHGGRPVLAPGDVQQAKSGLASVGGAHASGFDDVACGRAFAAQLLHRADFDPVEIG